jgi:signal transduction histidine kinase
MDPAGLRLIDGLPTGVLVTDAEGLILHANPRATEILSESLVALLGAPIHCVLAPIEELLKLAEEDSSHAGELVRVGYGASTIGFRVGTLEPGPSDSARYEIVFQEIGTLHRLREERDRLLKLAAVGEVLPALLHEIKNPLAGITTTVEVLLEDVPEGHVKRELVAVLGEVRRIKLTLEGIGVFSHQLHSPRRAPVHKALREAFIVVESQMRAKGIRGIPRIPDLAPLPMDVAVMRAFLFNLATNAVHACSAGDEIVVSLRLLEEGTVLELSVSDTGCGMVPGVLARCRELFFTTKSNGSGIGLALCGRMAEQSGGSMQIESQEGQGTTVTMRLPVGAPSVADLATTHDSGRRVNQ